MLECAGGSRGEESVATKEPVRIEARFDLLYGFELLSGVLNWEE